jgi:hypothetical protein
MQPALFYYLWIAPHTLLAVVLVLMVRRRLYKQFPIFLLYTAFELLQFMVLLAVFIHTRSLADGRYRGAFLVGAAISGALRFGIIYEIFVEVFRKYDALRDLSKVLFRCATVLLLLIGVALASTHGNGSDGFLLIVPILDRTVRFMQCGLLVFLFLFSRYFGISWRNYAFGIALGFGILASLELVDYAIRSQIVAGSYLLDYLGMATYHCSVLIWIFYLLAQDTQEPQEPQGPRTPRMLKKLPEHDLEAWNQELERLLHQ